MISIVICDDEAAILQQLHDYVADVFLEQKIEYEIQTFSQPVELLQVLD